MILPFNKGLIRIKSIFKTLRISYYNGKVGVYLRGGAGQEILPYARDKYFDILFIYFICI